jgi:hypothetical protein
MFSEAVSLTGYLVKLNVVVQTLLSGNVYCCGILTFTAVRDALNHEKSQHL